MYIEYFENFPSWEERKEKKISSYFYQAYFNLKETKNEFIDFDDVMFEDNTLEVIENLKHFGINEFTISNKSTALMHNLKLFQDAGAKIDGLVTINSQFGYPAPAIKLTFIK